MSIQKLFSLILSIYKKRPWPPSLAVRNSTYPCISNVRPCQSQIQLIQKYFYQPDLGMLRLSLHFFESLKFCSIGSFDGFEPKKLVSLRI